MSQPHDEWFHKLATLRVDMLSETERAAFAEHIQSCVSCQEQLNQYRVIDDSLRRYFSLPVLPAEPPLLPPALRALAKEHSQPGPVQAWREEFLPGKQFVGTFGMQSVFIALLAGLLTFVFGMYIVHVPGISPAIVTPLADIAVAAVILVCLAVMRSGLVLREEWSNATSSGPRYFSPASANHTLFPAHYEHPADPVASIDEPFHEPMQLPSRTANEKIRRDRGKFLLIPLILLSVGVASLFIPLLNPPSPPTPVALSPIGISSTGDQVFDINRKDITLKQSAAQAVLQGNFPLALQDWKQALVVDSDDAEVLIYQENQQVSAEVLAAPHHFTTRTLVAFTTLAQEHIGGGRDSLQGAYVAQKAYNDHIRQTGGTLLRLLIAVTNQDDASILNVTHQIVNAAAHDPSILGVMGLPTSKIASIAYPLLAQAHLPMISPTASSVTLSGVSPYFFRIPPPDTFQGRAGAQYAKNQLHAKTVALFVDDRDPYSTSLAQAFKSSFIDSLHGIILLPYQQGQPETIEAGFKRAEQLQKKPDLIYFAGFVNDASVVLRLLPPCSLQHCLKVMGGDALYVQGDYSLDAYKSYSRLIFTAFAFPTAWKAQGLEQEPAFFKEYTQDYDPAGQYQPGKYGFNQADADTILSYDAMQAFLHAMIHLTADRNNVTSNSIQQALKQIDANHAFQGVSRKIAFDSAGNPLDSQVVILIGESNDQTSLVSIVPGKN